MKRFFTAFLMLISGIFFSFNSHQVQAALCELTSPMAMLHISDDITLNPAQQGVAGTVLWSKTYPVTDISYKCESSTQSGWHSSYTRSYVKSQIDNVYATEIPGIGIRMKWPSVASGAWLPGNSGAAVTCSSGCSIQSSSVLIEFVQTGTLNAGESYIPVGSIAEASVIPTIDTSDKLPILSIILDSAIKIVPRSCSIYPSSNNIDLGTYSLADFIKDDSKQGDKKEFTITVGCPVTTSVTLQFSSVINPPFGASTGVLGVESGEGYAKNFLIRLYDKTSYSSPLALGKEFSYTASPTLTKTYQAEIYIPSDVDRKTQLTPGKVVGAVLYTMKIKG